MGESRVVATLPTAAWSLQQPGEPVDVVEQVGEDLPRLRREVAGAAEQEVGDHQRLRGGALFLGACLAALRWGVLPDGGNPHKHSRTQGAFATFGAPYLIYLLAAVTQVALKACW